MKPRILEEWVAAVRARGISINWWEREYEYESFEFNEGGVTYEVVVWEGGERIDIHVVEGMKVPLPPLVGLVAATSINSRLGREGVQIDCDENYVLWVSATAPIGAVQGASNSRLELAMQEARLLRELFFFELARAGSRTMP